MRVAVALLPLLLVMSASAAEGLSVRLRGSVVVASPAATLADVADVAGDPALVAALAGVVVQDLPDLAAYTLDERRLRQVLTRHLAGRALDVEGTAEVSRAVRTISAADIAAVAEARLRRDSTGITDVTVARAASAIVVPEDIGRPVVLVAEPLTHERAGEVPYRVKVVRDGRELARALVVLHARVFVDAVVATRQIPRGTVIGAGDLRTERIELRPGHPVPADDRAGVIGMQARLDLPPGEPIAARMVAPVPAVRGGRPVELRYVRGAVQMQASGVALADGAPGDVVQVRRENDGQTVQGLVVASGVVELRF